MAPKIKITPLREYLSLGEYIKLCKQSIQNNDKEEAIELLDEMLKGEWSVSDFGLIAMEYDLRNTKENPVG
jgi:hypothetical protein